MERDCWIERFWPGSHTGVLGWSGSLVGTFVGTDVSGREDESSSVFCGLFYMNVDQVSLRSGRGLHAPDFIVYQAAWGSQWSRSLTLTWCWSRYDRVLAHGFIMIMKVLIMFKIQIVSSVDCLLASVYLGSSRQVVKVVHFCILQEKSCTASLENKTEARTKKPESLSGFLAIKIQTYSPEGLWHIRRHFILSQVTKPGLCVLKYDISSCFALYFVVCVPVKIDNKMKYFISKRKRL